MYKVSALDSQHSKKGRDQSPTCLVPIKQSYYTKKSKKFGVSPRPSEES